ncbi:MAG: proline iminopeptidase-family hydrolase [Proteobacteria bacterium]|nr:proline iminopeptidase-family hydrolase [Pseudomonadota bacterium]
MDRRTVLGALAVTPFAANRALASNPQKLSGETGFINVPGGKVWWRRVGHGKKTPLLCLHGGPGAGSDYLFSMAALANDRPVIFYDQLGCGRSDAPNDDTLYRFPRFVDELDAVRSALGLHNIILYGNSWGSMLAIEYLLEGRGQGVEKLILSGAISSIPQAVAGEQRLIDQLPEGVGARLRQLEREGRESSPEYERLVELFYHLHLCRLDPWPADFAKTVANISSSPAYRVMNGPNEFTIIGNIKDWDRSKDLGAIKLPTLLTTGEFDEVTLNCHQTIRDAIAGAKLVVMKGCSHLTMMEQPKTYNRILREFIG